MCTTTNNNNVTLGGPAHDVALDVAEIAMVGTGMGLTLNTSKCELIAHSDFSVKDDLLQSFTRVDISDTTLLGHLCSLDLFLTRLGLIDVRI